jgi:phage replication O-like protein O
MANPQTENGYIRIANEIWEALAKIRISGEARQVFDAIVRKTWGWNKKSASIPLTQLEEMTGLRKSRIIESRKKLLKMNLIFVTKKGNSLSVKYCINKNFDEWEPLPKKVKNAGKVLKGRINVKEFKQVIRDRDNNCCLCCGYNGNLTKENLHVHHIDFKQKNNEFLNLITLCKSCHGKAHNNSDEHKVYLISLVTKKGNHNNITNNEYLGYQKQEFLLPKKGPLKDSKDNIIKTKENCRQKEAEGNYKSILSLIHNLQVEPRGEISQESYDTWLAPGVGVGFDGVGEKITLVAFKDDFHVNWMNENYQDLMSNYKFKPVVRG